MPTQRSTKPLELEAHGRGRAVAAFDDGPITSDAGLLLLRRLDQRLSVINLARVTDRFRTTCARTASITFRGWSVLSHSRILVTVLFPADAGMNRSKKQAHPMTVE